MKLSNAFFVVAFAFLLTACSEQKSEDHEQASAGGDHSESTVVTLNRQQLSHIHLETAEVNESAAPITMTLPGKVMLNERRRSSPPRRISPSAREW